MPQIVKGRSGRAGTRLFSVKPLAHAEQILAGDAVAINPQGEIVKWKQGMVAIGMAMTTPIDNDNLWVRPS